MNLGEFVRIGLALLFLASGALKLSSSTQMSQTLAALGFPSVLRTPGAIGLIVLELATGGLLVFGHTAVIGAWLSIALTAMFAVAVFLSMRQPVKVKCSCFGSASSEELGWGTIPRLAAMLAASVLLLIRGSLSELWQLTYEQAGLAVFSWAAVAGIYIVLTRIYMLLRA